MCEECGCEGEGGGRALDATYNQKPRSRRGSTLCTGWVAMIQGPTCVKERERKIATIQNQCRRLRWVESLELQKVERTIGPVAIGSTSPLFVLFLRREKYLMLDAFNPILVAAVLEAKDLPPFVMCSLLFP